MWRNSASWAERERNLPHTRLSGQELSCQLWLHLGHQGTKHEAVKSPNLKAMKNYPKHKKFLLPCAFHFRLQTHQIDCGCNLPTLTWKLSTTVCTTGWRCQRSSPTAKVCSVFWPNFETFEYFCEVWIDHPIGIVQNKVLLGQNVDHTHFICRKGESDTAWSILSVRYKTERIYCRIKPFASPVPQWPHDPQSWFPGGVSRRYEQEKAADGCLFRKSQTTNEAFFYSQSKCCFSPLFSIYSENTRLWLLLVANWISSPWVLAFFQSHYIAFSVSDPDDCLSSPCLYGICHDQYFAYYCECRNGYWGPNCASKCAHWKVVLHLFWALLNFLFAGCFQDRMNKSFAFADRNECILDSPCQNNGVCEDTVDSYTCHCPQFITGPNCEGVKQRHTKHILVI